MRSTPQPLKARQRGATLIVALVLLVAMALSALWAFNSSTTNTRIVGNMQSRQEAQAAAEAAVEQTISSKLFTEDPAAIGKSTVQTKVNGTPYVAKLSTPACYRAKVVKQSDLDPGKANDIGCMKSDNPDIPDGLGGASGAGDSNCADTEWSVAATVTDATTGAKVTIHQGVSTRIDANDATTACP